MKLFIKNMVCFRCKMLVKAELEKIGLHCTVVELGRAETNEIISMEQMEKLKIALLQSGLEVIENKKHILVEKIKNVVVERIYSSEDQLKTTFSDYLSSKLNLDYTYLANIFSEQQGTTIENFIITNKILRVKELIGNGEFNLTEISWKLNYSSMAHLSAQFKKVTGVTPSQFKHFERKRHTAFEKV